MKSLPGFAVNRVGSAPRAELFQFDTTGRVLLVLDRGVIAALAFGASEQDVDAHGFTPRFPSQHQRRRYDHLRG